MTHHTKFLTSTDVAPEEAWTKSSYSSQDGGNCIEKADLTDARIAVRDSKDKAGPALVFPTSVWASLVDMVKDSEIRP